MSKTTDNQPKPQAKRSLMAGVLLTLLVALALVGAFVYTLLFSAIPYQLPLVQSDFDQPSQEALSSEKTGYTITLDVGEFPGAILAQEELLVSFGQEVSSLPFAKLDNMRFTGWYTGPTGDADAYRVDNNSLGLIEQNKDQTLYARFEPRPTSIDHNDRGLPILMYHYFYDPEQGEYGEDVNFMDIHLFEAHLAWLQSQNYYYPTWEEVVAYIRGEIILPEPSIVLSSDDGHESFFRLAVPLVYQYGAKMTSFIVLVDLQPAMFPDIDTTKVIFHSHSYDMHQGGYDGDARILTASYQEIFDDALKGEDILGNMLAYCYPFGKTNANARQALLDAGVGVALVIEHQRAYPLCDPMQVPRLRMSDGSTVEFLASIA